MKKIGLLLAVLVAVASTIVAVQATVASAATQERFHGACGGGNTFAGFVAGLRKHGVLDDVLRAARIDPSGVDGDPIRLLRQRVIRVKVVKGDWTVANTTCEGGMFKSLRKATTQVAGSFVWALKWEIDKKTGALHRWWDEGCGNMRRGDIVVAYHVLQPPLAKPKPGKKPAPKPKPKPAGPTIITVGNCNAINSPGAVLCNQFKIEVNCGGVQVIFQGNNAAEVTNVATQYVQKNCPTQIVPPPTTTTTTPPTTTTTTPPTTTTTTTTESCQPCDPGPYPPPEDDPPDPVGIPNPDPPKGK